MARTYEEGLLDTTSGSAGTEPIRRHDDLERYDQITAENMFCTRKFFVYIMYVLSQALEMLSALQQMFFCVHAGAFVWPLALTATRS